MVLMISEFKFSKGSLPISLFPFILSAQWAYFKSISLHNDELCHVPSSSPPGLHSGPSSTPRAGILGAAIPGQILLLGEPVQVILEHHHYHHHHHDHHILP